MNPSLANEIYTRLTCVSHLFCSNARGVPMVLFISWVGCSGVMNHELSLRSRMQCSLEGSIDRKIHDQIMGPRKYIPSPNIFRE